MKKLNRLALGLCAVVGLSACSISFQAPSNRFDSPESVGRFEKGEEGKRPRIRAQGALSGETTVNLTSDYTARGPSVSDANFERDYSLRPNLGVGVNDRLDIDFKFPAAIQAKYQLIGAPGIQREAQEFKLSILGALRSSGGSGEGSSNSLFSSSGTATYQYTLDVLTPTAGLVWGYRFTKEFMLYSGYYFDEYLISGDWGLKDNTTKFSGRMYGYGATLGMEFSFEQAAIRVEGSHLTLDTKSKANARNYLGAVLAVYF